MAAGVRPIVRLFFPCDAITPDPTDGKWVVKNPWHTVQMPPGVSRKFGQEEILFYSQLTNGLGEFSLGVVMQAYGGSVVFGQSKPEKRTFTTAGRLEVVEVKFEMTQVPFPKPDLYVFRLIAGGVELEGGIAYLRVVAGEPT